MATFLYVILVVALVTLSTSELVIDVQPNVISPEITAQLVINCSITNNQAQNIDVIKSLTLSRYNETIRDFEVMISLDLLTLNLKQLVQFKYSLISFGNVFISSTILHPTKSDAKVYRCSVNGDNSNERNISLFAKKAVEYETNSTALIEEIRRCKKVESKCQCSLQNNDSSSYYKRSRVHFSGSSEIIKERIETVTLNCTYQALKHQRNETSLQSLYILHEANGVIANINKGQPVVQGSKLKNAEGEIFDNESKDSYLQVTWSNLKFSDSGKYFCEANVKHSDGRAERLSEMLILTVVSPTVDDLVKVVEKLLGQVDGDTKHIQENNQSIKNIKEELKIKEQNIISITADLNSTQQIISIMKKDITQNQQNISSMKEDLTINQENLKNVKEDLNIQQRNILSLEKDFNTHQQNISNFQENLEIVLSNFSTALMEVKNQTDKEDNQITSCRDVNSKDDRVVVTLASGLKVMCDTKTDGGGWIIFQRRINGKVDFYRNWQAYRDGFGDYDIGEFYLGNEHIYILTSFTNFDLRIDLKFNNQGYFAQYTNFKLLSEKEFYRLKIGDYSGNAGDSLLYHKDMYFSTYDKDNNRDHRNCATEYRGAWWYDSCHHSHLNGVWGGRDPKGLIWDKVTDYYGSASFTEMKIREKR
ncbi:BgMFREP13.1 [Biomphalaria glabrata]|nr:FREP13.1 Fibroleukin-like Resistant factor [Biomphalaria glabrata]